jgi:hypothetical protein
MPAGGKLCLTDLVPRLHAGDLIAALAQGEEPAESSSAARSA